MGTSGTGLAAALAAVAVEGLAHWLSSRRRRKEPEALPPSRSPKRLPAASDDAGGAES
jgi:uncharacterized membrane protein YebE (DUF533 family)